MYEIYQVDHRVNYIANLSQPYSSWLMYYLFRINLTFISVNQDHTTFKQCSTDPKLGDNCIQNFHLGRYIVGYTVGNLVLRRRASGAVKRDFRTYIRRYTSPNENFEYGYPHSYASLQFALKVERCNGAL